MLQPDLVHCLCTFHVPDGTELITAMQHLLIVWNAAARLGTQLLEYVNSAAVIYGRVQCMSTTARSGTCADRLGALPMQYFKLALHRFLKSLL